MQPSFLRGATLVGKGILSYEGRPLLKRMKLLRGAIPASIKNRIAGGDSCFSYGRRLLLQSGPDDSAEALPFLFLIPVVRPISGLPNGSPDGGCKSPPGPGQIPPKFLPRLMPIWLKSEEYAFWGAPLETSIASLSFRRKKIKTARHVCLID